MLYILNVCFCLHTWSEHLLSHEKVIESTDIVPTRQEHQDCSFLSKTWYKTLNTAVSHKIQQGLSRLRVQQTRCPWPQRSWAEADTVDMICSQLPTSTFTFRHKIATETPTSLWQMHLYSTGEHLINTNKSTDLIFPTIAKRKGNQ